MRELRLVVGFALVALLAPRPVLARPYPVNACVAAKQDFAADYCQAALDAWSRWDKKQDAVRRDKALHTAAGKLTNRWADADTNARSKGTDCADTTLSAAAAVSQIDSAIGALVDAINDGLDLSQHDQAKCGAKLLGASAAKCAALLGAEARFVRKPAKDTHGTKRDAARTKASDAFSHAFGKVLDAGCPSTATVAGAESMIDAISAGIVRDTTISPHVDDAKFTTISPTGSIQYLGKTLTPTCIKDTPYSFFVKRGSVNKLLVYYEGGGACWEQLTCTIPTCDATVVASGNGSDNPNDAHSGFADRSNPANPFRDWNVVFVSYCSCDIHFGDAAQDYSNTDPAHPVHIEHRGYQNARVVEKWAREHFVSPEEIFVTGSSAGAYGAWFHAPLLQEVWPASRFQVLADAGNGVVTQDFLTQFFPNWNFEANLPPEFPELKQVLDAGTGIPGYTEAVAKRFPETRWAHYATAYDGGTGGQTGFYNIMLNDNNPIAALSWWNGSCAFNQKMVEQALATAAVVPTNYRYYIGTGSRHTMWGSNKVYADTTGGVPTLVDWVSAMIDGSTAWTNVECTNCGLLLAGDPRPPTIPTPPFQQVGSDVVVVCSPGGAFLDAGD